MGAAPAATHGNWWVSRIAPLQHTGTMTKAAGYSMDVAIVPDSGTGELAGIAGRLTILIAPGGAHSYKLAYTLPGG